MGDTTDPTDKVVAIIEMFLGRRDARIAELERERDEARLHLHTVVSEVQDLIGESHGVYGLLRDCLALASRHRHEEWAQHIMRFCARGGAVPSPLRGEG